MATAVFAAAGAALGGAAGAAIGGNILGISAVTIGTGVGRLLGGVAGSALMAGSRSRNDTVTVGRLTNQQIMASQEGSPIARIWGRARIAGTMIWWARFKESVTTTTSTTGGGGGKGGGGGGGGSTTTTKSYSYSLSFAVGLCEGPVQEIGRIWLNGKKLDESAVRVRRYYGTESQEPDPTIEAIDGSGNAPAYRGLAYLVFDDLPLAEYGNRVPQVSAEVQRIGDPLPIEGVCLIPGSTEFGYDTVEQVQTSSVPGAMSAASGDPVATEAINVHQVRGRADVLASLDGLETSLPSIKTVLVVIGWFFDDLRCAETVIEPRVEIADKTVSPGTWTVSGIDRAAATEVSYDDGVPAYGSTPDDLSVFRLFQELKDRGLNVIVYPFLFGDVPAGNTQPNPYGGTGQPVYPWRGRITLSAAPGQSGSPDKTSAAADEVAAFFGDAEPADFGAWTGATIPYSGPSSGGVRRMILHYAKLAAAAGLGSGDAIAIGSEMVALNEIRSDATTFPAVAEWKSLAADVRSIVGSDMEITYASDWSETTFFQPDDGSGDLFHHLDPLWADSNIDFIGVDTYLPLADINPDAPDDSGDDDRRSKQFEINYLRSQVEGGEYWDYYYASEADRNSRTRTSITDTAYGKPWVFRRKGFRDWWSNEHYDRPGGTESGTATAWTPKSKRIVFTEYGFAAIDLTANQPNAFYDPKSSESKFPYHSSGVRSDAAQHQALRALLGYWTDNMPEADDSSPMIDLSMSCAWAWDARPYPAFPALSGVWSDAENYATGHWLNGRGGALTVGRLLEAVAADYGFSLAAEADHATVQGFAIEEVTSFRDATAPVFDAWAVDLVDNGVQLKAVSRAAAPRRDAVTLDALAQAGEEEARFQRHRSREDDQPGVVQVRFSSTDSEDYDTAAVSSVHRAGGSGRLTFDLPAAIAEHEASMVAERLLREAHAQRETLRGIALPPTLLDCEPGDILQITDAGTAELWQITAVSGALTREAEARRIDPGALEPAFAGAGRSAAGGGVTASGSLSFLTMIPLDLPQLDPGVEDHRGYIAVFASPWPGPVQIHRSLTEGSGYAQVATAPLSAIIGSTRTDLPRGPEGRWHEITLRVEIASGTLGSLSEAAVLAGGNAVALETPDGWEILQFREAELVSPGLYDLNGLLRGQLGTEDRIQDSLAAGAGFVVLNEAIVPVPMTPDDVNLPYWWKLVPYGTDPADTGFAAFQHAFTGAGQRPWSPVHVTGARDGSGNLTISWMRRSRTGSSWGAIAAPLGEDSEAYEVDILDGATVVRTIATASETASYSAAEQAADFGAAQASVDVVVYQVGATYGRGSGRAATV